MIAMTPSGMRILPTCKPLGRRHILTISPTGSGRAAISLSPFPMAWMRAGFRAIRSSRALESPAALAKSRSLGFSPKIASLSPSSRSAIRSKARFFSSEESLASRREASLALFPNSTASFLSDIACSQARGISHKAIVRCPASDNLLPVAYYLVPSAHWLLPIAFLQQHQIVSVDDFVIELITQNLFDLACMQSFNLIQLLRAVVDQPAGKLPPLKIETPNALPHAKGAVNLLQTRREEAFASENQGLIGTLVNHDLSRRFQVIGDPVLTACQPVLLRDHHRPRLLTKVKEPRQNIRDQPVGNQGGDPRGGGLFRRADLRRNAARSQRALTFPFEPMLGCLDVRNQRNQTCVLVDARVEIEDTIHIAQHDQQVRLQERGHERGKMIVVPELHFLDSHRVVLVHDRDDGGFQQGHERVLSIEIASPIGQILVGEKHLSHVLVKA